MAQFIDKAWYEAKVIDASYGRTTRKETEVLCASVLFKITYGDCKDKTISFEETRWDPKYNGVTFYKLKLCGWQGKDAKAIGTEIKAAAKTVRLQIKWVDYGTGFWAIDKIAPAERTQAATVADTTADDDAFMRQAIADAERADSEYKIQKAGDRQRIESRSEQTKVLKAGDWCPANGCDAVIQRKSNGDLVCEAGHEVTPF